MSKIKCAGIFIVSKDGKLLICHPTNHAKDFFSIPKGKVEKSEGYLEAAFRETYEETNLDLAYNINFVLTELEPVNYSHKKKILYPFVLIESDESEFDWENVEIKCNSNVPEERGGFPEMDDYQWVSILEAKLLLHDTQVACLDKIKELIS